jgi:hypothetical protein
MCSRRMMAEPVCRKCAGRTPLGNALNDRIATRATASSGPGPCSGVTLDGDATNGARRPEEPAHTPYTWFLLITAVLAGRTSSRSTGRKRLTPTHRAGNAHKAQPML